MSKLVFNIRTASASAISSVSVHCKNRKQDGWSAIDVSRSHLNRQTFGSGESVTASLKSWYQRTGAKRPAKQSENPYLTIVLSSSNDLFAGDGGGVLDEFERRSLLWLQEQFGDDVVHVELHLDETTPHLHAVVAPTYFKSKRVPGRKKKNETEDDFRERKAIAIASPGVRTVSWSSSKYAYPDSFDDLRKSCVEMMADLGIIYGEVRRVGPSGQSTREWVKSMKVKVSESWAHLKLRWAKLMEREDRLLVALERLSLDREDLVERSSSLFLALMEVRKIETRLSGAFRTLKKNMPLSSMSPGQRARMEPVYSSISEVLKEADVEISEHSKRVVEIDQGPESVGLRAPR